jgi:putative transposase
MPNHFHFLIAADERTEVLVPNQKIPLNAFSNGMRHLLSSYTKAINSQEGFCGNLFQQKTQSKCVLDLSMIHSIAHYDEACFHYIHQNPARAGLVEKMEDWKYSSFNDYAGFRNGTLCNVSRGLAHFDYSKEQFLKASYQVIKEDIAERIF